MALPVVVAGLIGGLVQATGSIVGRVLLSLGMSVVCYVGLDILTDFIIDEIWAALDGAPSMFLQILGVLQIATAINILFSAFLSRLTLSGLTSGVLSRWVAKC